MLQQIFRNIFKLEGRGSISSLVTIISQAYDHVLTRGLESVIL